LGLVVVWEFHGQWGAAAWQVDSDSCKTRSGCQENGLDRFRQNFLSKLDTPHLIISFKVSLQRFELLFVGFLPNRSGDQIAYPMPTMQAETALADRLL
jgi:hypothetical protein